MNSRLTQTTVVCWALLLSACAGSPVAPTPAAATPTPPAASAPFANTSIDGRWKAILQDGPCVGCVTAMSLNISRAGSTYTANASWSYYNVALTGGEEGPGRLSLSGTAIAPTQVTLNIGVDPVVGLSGTLALDYNRPDLAPVTYTVLSASRMDWAVEPGSFVGTWNAAGRAVSCEGACPPNVARLSDLLTLYIQQSGQSISGLMLLTRPDYLACCPGLPLQGRVRGTNVELDAITLPYEDHDRIPSRVEVAAMSFERVTETSMQGSITYTLFPNLRRDAEHFTFTSAFTLTRVLP